MEITYGSQTIVTVTLNSRVSSITNWTFSNSLSSVAYFITGS